MDMNYEERIWWILRGGDGSNDQFDKISEFKLHLNDAGLAEQKLNYGCVLWRSEERETATLQHKITTLFSRIVSRSAFCFHYMMQFWAVVEEAEGHRRLSASDQPFCIGSLNKGLCWYRKLCMDHEYRVDDGADVDQLGGVGRAYRNRRPESTPDLRLYSADEFPLHDQAARCSLRGYLTLPLFDFRSGECYGVLELISRVAIGAFPLSTLDAELQNAGLRSTHIDFRPITQSIITPEKYREKPESEITEILELAIKEVPQLQLAQVWVPCKQCANMRCMERTSFINAWDKRVNSCSSIDADMFVYLQACDFHYLQLDLNYTHQNLCDLSISKNPLAHHAKKARLFHSFAVHLQSLNNGGDHRVLEFFLQPRCSQDSCIGGSGSSLHSLIRIIEMKLKSFKLASRELFPPQSRQPNYAIECESLDMVSSHMKSLSETDFTEYLEAADSCLLQPSSHYIDSDSDEEWPDSIDEIWPSSYKGWVFCQAAGDELSEVKEKMKRVVKKIVSKLETKYSMVQFWAAEFAEGRCYLQTCDQPYGVGCLARGLASFRKKCMRHRYFVDDEAKEDELGPPGRVFRNKHPEITPGLSLYSKKDFPFRNYAVDSRLQQYYALPVFDKHSHKCVGVLELLGFNRSKRMTRMIRTGLEKTSLCSTHIGISPSSLGNDKPPNIINSRKQAWTEINEAFLLVNQIPQLHMAQVLVPHHEECDGVNKGNTKCMELALSTKNAFFWDWIHVEPGKGIIGVALESESKSCFCRNLCEFSIDDQPLVHEEMRERVCACFVICLKSSHTGELLYVMEFFLNPSPRCLVSFLNFLLPIMTLKLKSFNYACGRKLGEELVVDVIDFSEARIDLVSELGQPDVFPIKYTSVRYGHQHAEADPVSNAEAEQTENSSITVASDLKKTKRQRRGTRLNLCIDDLKPHFGKKLEDAAEDIGVGRSTIKRACRDNGIGRWPCKGKQTRNPSLYEGENGVRRKHVVVEEGDEKVMVKAKYEEDTIKFEFCLSSGVSKLYEEVGAGLNLKVGTFKLKYLDEDDDEILLSRDADLQHCPKTQTTAVGKICIRLFVHLISKLA